MKNTKYLKEFIRETILNENVSTGNSDLAAFLEDSSEWGIKAITLYSSSNLLKNLEDTDSSVLGYIAAQKPKNPCAGAWEVKMSGGKGYGGILYPAMFAAVGGPLMPDRSLTSDKAISGWSKQSKREKTPLDSAKAEKDQKLTPEDPSDDCEVRSWKFNKEKNRWEGDQVLDNAYDPFGSENAILKKLLSKHEETMNEVEKKGVERQEIEIKLSRSGIQKFNVELYG